jgi:hypothetical protein
MPLLIAEKSVKSTLTIPEVLDSMPTEMDLGLFSDHFTKQVAAHGAELFKTAVAKPIP